MNNRCENCRFFIAGQNDVNDCRRNPPQIIVLYGANKISGQAVTQIDSIFPKVAAASWCGEHRLAAKEQLDRAMKLVQ